MKDHPLLLVPREERRRLLEEHCRPSAREGASDSDFVLADALTGGELCHYCRRIHDALLGAYRGDWLKVLRHVQVERFYVVGPLPAVGGHGGAAALGRRRVPAGDRRPERRGPPAGAPHPQPPRAPRPAGGGQPRPGRVLRPAQAAGWRPSSTCSAPASRARCSWTTSSAARPGAGGERQREAAGRVQGDPRLRLLPRAARAGARALPAPRLGGAGDLRPAGHAGGGRASTWPRTPPRWRPSGRCSPGSSGPSRSGTTASCGRWWRSWRRWRSCGSTTAGRRPIGWRWPRPRCSGSTRPTSSASRRSTRNYEGRLGASAREVKTVLFNAAQAPGATCLTPRSRAGGAHRPLPRQERPRVPAAGGGGRVPRPRRVRAGGRGGLPRRAGRGDPRLDGAGRRRPSTWSTSSGTCCWSPTG